MDYTVSICLPTLNARPYLEERLQSIFAQTFQQWELIVADSFSSDGTWEFLKEKLSNDPRCKLFQIPRGLYQAWNFCIEKSQGDFVYIATADDSFESTFLEEMSAALIASPDCSIAHCNLRVDDANGLEVEGFYPAKCRLPKIIGSLINQPHKRLAPHDGLLHYEGGTVIVSITQLLIRRETFSKIGAFRTDLGPSADFEWGMRVGLTQNVVHIAEYLASWRIHEKQVTSFQAIETPESYLHLHFMTRLAWEAVVHTLPNQLENWRKKRTLWEFPLLMNALSLELAGKTGLGPKLAIWLKYLLKHPVISLEYAVQHLKRNKFSSSDYIKDLMNRYGLDKLIQKLILPH